MDVLTDQMPFVAPEEAFEELPPPVCPDTIGSPAERALQEKFGTTVRAERFNRHQRLNRLNDRMAASVGMWVADQRTSGCY